MGVPSLVVTASEHVAAYPILSDVTNTRSFTIPTIKSDTLDVVLVDFGVSDDVLARLGYTSPYWIVIVSPSRCPSLASLTLSGALLEYIVVLVVSARRRRIRRLCQYLALAIYERRSR